MSPRILFEQELKDLNNNVKQMGEHVEDNYDKLLRVVKGGDRSGVRRLMEHDRDLTDMLRGIESKCLSLMTRQQPVAGDLRIVTAALKVVTDMERIGDHVSDMAELFLRMDDEFRFPGWERELLSMMEEVGAMLHSSVEAYINQDTAGASKAIEQDDAVDNYFNRMKEHIMEDIRNHTPNADKVVDLLMTAKYLEKIGDHAVNICEWAIFQQTGDLHRVRLL